MTPRYEGDICPACGSIEVQPYAVIVGAAETYGYQCLACAVMWPVIRPRPPAAQSPAPALSYLRERAL